MDGVGSVVRRPVGGRPLFWGHFLGLFGPFLVLARGSERLGEWAHNEKYERRKKESDRQEQHDDMKQQQMQGNGWQGEAEK